MQMFLSVNLCSDKTSVFLCLNAKEMLSQMSIYRFLGIVWLLVIPYLCTNDFDRHYPFVIDCLHHNESYTRGHFRLNNCKVKDEALYCCVIPV